MADPEMTPEFAKFLVENGYKDVRPIPGDRWAGVFQFMFTWAIMTGPLEDRCEVSDRWCYKTYHDALRALEATDWSTPGAEPSGWHRHPFSGRRRGPDYEMQLALGNDTEYVDP